MGSQKTSRDRPLQRGRTEAIVGHTSRASDKFPKFLVLYSESEKPLSKLFPFLVQKVLANIIGLKFQVKKMSSGDLLVEIDTKKQSDSLLPPILISDYKVSVSPHRSLNTVRGVISEDDLLDESEPDILEGMSDQSVVAVSRITLRKGGEIKPTKHMLTFDATALPEPVKAGY